MRNYSLLKTIPLSFYSRELYSDVRYNWPGIGFAYLLFLLTLLAVPNALVFSWMLSRATLDYPVDFRYVINQVPDITLKNGTASVESEQPRLIRLKETGEVIAVIDTTRPVTDAAGDYDEVVVIGKKDVLFKDARRSRQEIHALPADADTFITRETLTEIASALLEYAWVLPWVGAPLLILVFFMYYAALVLFYGAAAKIMSFAIRTDIDYTDAVRMAAVAITPAILLTALFALLDIRLAGLTYFVLAMLYLYFGIRSTR